MVHGINLAKLHRNDTSFQRSSSLKNFDIKINLKLYRNYWNHQDQKLITRESNTRRGLSLICTYLVLDS